MENASKALIIAGAILIAIVLVSVGVIVVNSLNTDSAVESLDETQIQAFNAKFEASLGTNVSGTTVKQLISTIITNNNSNSDDTSRQITVTYNGSEQSDLSSLRNSILSAVRYKVSVDSSTGYLGGLIHVIDISANS